MEGKKGFKFSQFVSVTSYLCAETSKIIKAVWDKGELNTKLKGVDDPFTQADLKAQSLLYYGYKRFFPELLVIGEEDLSLLTEPKDYDFTKINENLVCSSLFCDKNSGVDYNNLNVEDLIVWVDPLDGTSDFLRGDLECISTLIGVSCKGLARAGVMCRMYDKVGESFIFKPRIYFGITDVKHVYQIELTDLENQKVTELTRPEIKLGSKISLAASKSHYNKETEAFMNCLENVEIRKIGGCGNKYLHIIEGLEDCMLYVGKGTRKWDSCAGDALMECIGGKSSMMNGEPNPYLKEETTNLNGIFAVASKEVYEHQLKRILAVKLQKSDLSV